MGRPEPFVEVEQEDDEVEDESELILEKVEEEMAAEISDEEEENLLHIDDLQNLRVGNKVILVWQAQILVVIAVLEYYKKFQVLRVIEFKIYGKILP